MDASQLAVMEACQAPCAVSVIGAAGTGKTHVLQELVARIVAENPQARIAVLSPDRRAATDLRNRISVQLGALSERVTIQSITAFAFSIVSQYAQAVGRREPELLSGPDQDALLKEVFDAMNDGDLPGIFAEGFSGDVTQLPAFRAEFRDLLTRAAELTLDPQALADLGQRYDQPMWIAGAKLMEIYERTLATQAATTSTSPDQVDHARILIQAAAMLRGWEAGTESKTSGKLNVQQPQWDWVLVDDVQNATLGLRTLLQAVKEGGASIVTFGDPDLAVNGFRGGIAHLPTLLTRPAPVGVGAQLLTLGTRYRAGGEIADVTMAVTGGIHTAGIGRHRKATWSGEEGDASAVAYRNSEEELADIATRIRSLHVQEGVPYADMAVLTRSNAEHAIMRQAFVRYGIPCAPVAADIALREQTAVAALLELIRVALADELTVAEVEAVLLGRLISIDPLMYRRMRRELHGWDLAAGDHHSATELTLAIIDGGIEAVEKVGEFARVRALVAAIRAARGRLAEEVLWVAWEGLGLAEKWRTAAMGTGPVADAAHADLDAIMQLFRVAQRLADRDPHNAGISVFLDHMADQDLPEDSIARSATGDALTLATPSSAVGREWEHVFITGINDGAWPNTKLRNPLTHVPELVSVVVGEAISGADSPPTQMVREVIDDELRLLLYAVTRARSSVTLTCINSEELLPSRFLDWLTGGFADADEGSELDVADNETAQHPLRIETIRLVGGVADADQLIGELRQAIRGADPNVAEKATEILTDLGQHIEAALAESWVDDMDYTPFELPDAPVHVSPSAVEQTLTCPLRAFFSSIGAEDVDARTGADLGTFIHSIAEDNPHGTRTELREAFAERWARLGLEENRENSLLQERAANMIEFLADYLESKPGDVIVESFASATHKNIVVRGKLDRIERSVNNPAHVEVADFKTGSQRPRKAELAEHPQLLIYQWLINQGAIEVPAGEIKPTKSLGARLVQLGSKNKSLPLDEQPEIGASGTERAETFIEQAAELSTGPDFEARPGAHCRTCRFSRLCPAQDGERIFS